MNLEFTLATTDEEGNALSPHGVEYIAWTGNYPIDCDAFMSDNSGRYVKYLWDPNQYINVLVYNFAEDDSSGGTTLGISHLPFSTKGSTYLEGLTSIDYTRLTLDNLKFPYCVSINSLYINEESTAIVYNSADVVVTTAHELGHYLGLYHVFSETEDETGCEDTDYCEDTPSYDKSQYELDWEYLSGKGQDTFENLVKRTNCDGGSYISRNIMDYAVSYSDEFTPDQRTRIRHVLNYSPLIPGPKQQTAATRSAPDGPLDLPIAVKK